MRTLRTGVVALAMALIGCALAPAAGFAQDGCETSGSADESIVISGGTNVDAGETADDVFVIDGDVNVAGAVEGDVIAVSGDVTVSGCIGGDLTTLAGKATLLPRARVDGDVIYSDEQPRVAPGAQIGGELREENWDDLGDVPWGLVGAAALWIAVGLSLLVSGVALVAIFPRAATAAGNAARSQAALTVAMGLAVAIGLPLAAGFAFVTLLGIPLAIVLGLAMIPLAWIGYLVCSVVLGQTVTREGTHAVLAFLAGLGILRAIALIPIVGALAWIPIVIVGLGALVVAAMDTEATTGHSG